MGRKSKPATVHFLNGNPSKKTADELLQAMSKVPIELPSCPAHLGPEARAEWRRIGPHLVAAGLVTHQDRAALAAYCESYGEWVVIARNVKAAMATGGAESLIDKTPSGYKQVSAMAQARDRALDRMLRFAKEFGLTPASRINSTTDSQLTLPGVEDDPMENFLQAGAPLSQATH